MNTEKKAKRSLLSVAITLLILFLLIKFGIPLISREITGLDFPLTVPGTLFLFYAILISIGTFVYVSSDEDTLEDFIDPIKKTYTGHYGKMFRNVVFVLVPVILGAGVFSWVRPTVASPVALRVQHPSSNFPKKFENMENPMENPTDEELAAFIEQVKSNTVEFLPQVHEAKRTFTNIDHIPTKPVVDFLAALKGGNASNDLAKAALREKRLFEGRAMFEINCRPCHGDSTAGDGPMAYGFKLRPINFTDNGTLEVLVEGYIFWRILTGGLGLPMEATSWDSAMPVWGLDLTDNERWVIMMGELDLAEKTSRIREKL